MNGYKAFYNGRTTEVHADTSYKAMLAAAAFFKVPANKAHKVSVVLCEKAGEQVTHSTAAI